MNLISLEALMASLIVSTVMFRSTTINFLNYLRMTKETFDSLLGKLERHFYRKETNFRRPMSPGERLVIILRIQSFQKRYDATAVMLVFDAHELEDFIGPGYHHPKKPVETPQGLDCYPIMFSYPIKPLNHMPNVVQIITERASELSAMDRVVFSFSQRDQSTYILSRIDPRVTFVVVFDTKKGEKESYITTFVYDLSLQLRCNKVFANLKMNTK